MQSQMDNPEKLATTNKNPQKNNTICVGHHYAQVNTNNVNNTSALLQAIGGTVRTEYRFYAEIVTDIPTRNSELNNARGQHKQKLGR